MHRSCIWLPALATLSLAFCPPAQAFLYDGFSGGPGFPNRVDDYIDNIYMVNPSQPVDIIVDFCSTPMPPDSTFLAGYGTVYKVFRFIDAIAVQGVVASDCYNIVNYPRVKLIEWDQTVLPQLDVSCRAIQARASVPYPYPAQAAWDLNPPRGVMGNGVNVAILDSGVDDQHAALAGKFVAGYNAFTGLGGPGVNPDDDWVGWYHGTAVAGMIMANDPNQQYMGVAPHAGLVDCKIFDATGSGSASGVIGTIWWVLQNAATHNIAVANMSFGARLDDGTDALSRAANALSAAGVIVVASAGNSPPASGISSPAAGDGVICVGGVDDAGTVPRADDLFDPAARTGPRASPPPAYALGFNDLKPEVSAYMHSITTCRGSNPGQGGAGWWQHPGNGTSWAAAHTSGVVALLLEKYPGLSQTDVENQLRTTAEARGGPSYPWLDPKYNIQYGSGIVSAARAVNTPIPVDVSLRPWVPGTWNSKSIWAGHYPVQVGDPNTLNARVYSKGGSAPGVTVTFEAATWGWSTPYTVVGVAVVNVPANGSAVATIPFTPPPSLQGHRCFRVTLTYPPDINPSNNVATENIDVQPAHKAVLASRQGQRYAFPVTMCVEPTVPFPFRTADACICTKDLPPGASAWLEPEPPFDLAPGECQPCSLIVVAPEGVSFSPGDAVYVNGWFWGNGVSEAGVTAYFISQPPLEVTVDEIQYTDDPLGASPLVGQTVTVSGIATAGNGTYPDRFPIQDGEGPWSGLFVRDVGLVVERGDEVVVTGEVVETGGLTEIDMLSQIETMSSGNPPPSPAAVAPGVISTDESYEGVLVEAENVIVTDASDPSNWEITSDGSCRVGRWGGYAYSPYLGDELNVTGVVGSLEELLKLQPRDDDDITPATGTPDEPAAILSLSQNLPNPFRGETGISYTLPADTDVVLAIYNVAGQVVRTLVDGKQPAGEWTIVWDGKDDDARLVSNGVYFYSLKAGGKTIGKRMVLVE